MTKLTEPFAVIDAQEVKLAGIVSTAAQIDATVTEIADMFVFNVRYYGAVGDGNADDTTPITNAINAAHAVNGTVFFPPGTYITTLLTVYSYMAYIGAGSDQTIIKLKNSSNSDVLRTYNFASLTNGGTNGGAAGFIIQGLTIDGNKANQSTGNGITIYGYRYTLIDVQVKNAHNIGIYSEYGLSPGPAADGGLMECLWRNVRTFSNGSHGIDWRGPHDSRWDNILSYLNSGNGILTSKDSSNHWTGMGLVISEVHCYANTLVGFVIGTTIAAFNLISESNTGDGIKLAANNVVLVGMQLYQNIGHGLTLDSVAPPAGCFINGVISSHDYQVYINTDGGNNIFDLYTWNDVNQHVFHGTFNPSDNIKINSSGSNPQQVSKGPATPMTQPSLPGGIGSGNTVTNSNLYPVIVYQRGMNGTVIVDTSNTAWSMGIDSTTFILPSGAGVYYTVTRPAAWYWQPLLY